MRLGEFIKDYRTKNKITMQQFADAAGLSKGYVSVLEKGKRPNSSQPTIPSIETYNKVATAMRISLNELLESLDDDCLIDITNTADAQAYRESVDYLIDELSAADHLQVALSKDDVIGDYKFSDDQLLQIIRYARFIAQEE